MGLFGKDKKADNSVFDTPDYATMANERTQSRRASSDRTQTNNHRRSEKSASEYGIQDAIELMRQLPNVNTDIVIGVVIKTLESAKIQVSEIISDAQERETRIENRSVELASEIEDLDVQIKKLNGEIKQLNGDLEETSKVKDLLMASVEHAKVEENETSVATSAMNDEEEASSQDKDTANKTRDAVADNISSTKKTFSDPTTTLKQGVVR